MSHKLINHNQDLKRLRDKGYDIEITDAHLIVHDVPYVNSDRKVCYGKIVSELTLAGEKTVKPGTHVIHFAGDFPCDKDGNIIKQLQHQSANQNLGGITVNHSFSNKPANGYEDYYQKITTYIMIISHQAAALDPSATAQTFKVRESTDSDNVFNYSDTNSSRAEINAVSLKLQNQKVAIVGLGGTGSYVLDFVAKTWVKEVHLFDADDFLSHNSFRSPGAASIDELNEKPKKVTRLQMIYSKLRKKESIIIHEYHIDPSNVAELDTMDFVFICIDKGDDKKSVIERLIGKNIPFVDVGIGVETVDDSLLGNIRVTACSSKKNNHIKNRISFSGGENDDYDENIQIAELNALNAALAVIKWKKMFGFYLDYGQEYNSVYDINSNLLINDEIAT